MDNPFDDIEGFQYNGYSAQNVDNILNKSPMRIQTTSQHELNGDSETLQISEVTENVVKPDSNKVLVVQNVEVLRYLINSLSGKDKSAKILKYVLELVKIFITNFIKTNKSVQFIPLNLLNLKSLLLHPKLLLLLFFTKINKNLSYVVNQLSTYRYILRFGNSPFLIANFISKLKKVWHYDSKSTGFTDSFYATFINETSLREMLDLYYTICDEMVLLHKFKIWSNPTLYDRLSRHETLAWQYDILLSLKDKWLKLNQLQKRKLELDIQIQVKEKAINYYRDNLAAVNTSPIRRQLTQDLRNNTSFVSESENINKQLQDIDKQKKDVYIDLVKLSFDCCANSIYVFNLKVPSATYPILSLGSGVAGFIKLWKDAKEELIKERSF